MDTWQDTETGAVTLLVELNNGTVIRRHMDQLKLNMTGQGQSESDPSSTSDIAVPEDITSDATTPELRHSSRTRRPPSRFSPDNY